MKVKPGNPLTYKRTMPWSDGTVAHWMFGGSIPAQNIVRANPALYLNQTNNPPALTHAPGRILSFTNGNQQFLTENTSDSALRSIGPLTISMLWRPNGDYITTQTLASCTNGPGNGCYTLEYGRTDNAFTLLQNGGSVDFTSSASYGSDTWFDTIFIRDGSTGAWTFRLIVNGAVETATSTVNPNTSTGMQFNVGRFGSAAGNWLTGLVSDVRIWNKALTVQQALAYQNHRYDEFMPSLTYAKGPAAAAGGFQAAWASQRSRTIGAGVI